jgi:hypothetical protein
MQVKRAPGPDGIHGRVLKEARFQIDGPLLHLFELSLSTGIVPSLWRHATVIPIFKGGSSCTAKNYRPISLTPILSKVMERILHKSISSHLDTHHLLSPNQYGFRSRYGTEIQLLSYQHDILSHMENSTPVDVFYADAEKAFDKVPFPVLLWKLEKDFKLATYIKWIKNFLTCRSQQVSTNGHLGISVEVVSGVPQGTVLGPLLFSMFINDLPDVIQNSQTKMFADDTKIYAPINNPGDQTVFQQDIDHMHRWYTANGMALNESKCKILQFGRGDNNIYSLNGQPLETTTTMKDLGIVIDNKLSLNAHRSQAANKANQKVGLYLRHFKTRETKSTKLFLKSYVRPHLDYCSSVINPWQTSERTKLEAPQRRLTKTIRGLRDLPYIDRLSQLNLNSIATRRDRNSILQLWKMNQGYYDVSESSRFIQENNSRHNTRSRNHLQVPLSRTNRMANSFSRRAPDLFNSAKPLGPTLNDAKSSIKSWCTDRDAYHYPR